MKPYNLIQDLERSINNVKYQLKYSKDKKAAETIVKDLKKLEWSLIICLILNCTLMF